MKQGKPLYSVDSFIASQNTILDLIFMENINFISIGSADQFVHLVDIEKCFTTSTFQGHKGSIKCLCNFNDNILSGGRDSQIFFWDLKSLNPIFQKTFKNKLTITSIIKLNDLMFISSDSNGEINCWDIRNIKNKLYSISYENQSTKYGISNLSISNNKKYLASICTNNNIIIHKLDGTFGYKIRNHYNLNSFYNRCSFSPCSKYLISGSSSGTLNIFSIKNNNLPYPLYSHSGPACSVDWNNNFDYILSTSDDKTIQLWFAEYFPLNENNFEEDLFDNFKFIQPIKKIKSKNYTLDDFY